MIEVKNVTKNFYSKKSIITVNNDISFIVPKGKILGLLGPNGAGKTTLIKIICNLIIPTSGVIEIDKKNIHEYPNIVHEKIGVVLEGARNLYNFLTIEENLNYFSYLNEIPKNKIKSNKDKLLKLFDLEDKRNVTVNTLSRGMQQKVAILVAILKDPEILILDEPTLGLDVMSQIKMKSLLKSLVKSMGKTLIISSHDMSLIKDICDNVCILYKGKLIAFGKTLDISLNSSIHQYKLILKNKDYLINMFSKKNYKFQIINESSIECICSNIDYILKEIKSNDIYIIERIDNSIEEFLKGLGGNFENDKSY